MLEPIDYSLFAANSYAAAVGGTSPNVSATNEIPVVSGWSVIRDGVSNATGFLARAYQSGNDIVIAYAGTTSEPGMATLDWTNGNIPGASGFTLATQITDAARFYLDVRKANPNAAITFTGHSLGGDDRIDGGAGNDIVIGGAGRDILVEGDGDDKLYADGAVSVAAALAAQDAAPSGVQGEALSGGAGDDLAVGGSGNDALLGGTGADILIGGAGDDTIDGEAMTGNIMRDWSVTRSVATDAAGVTRYQRTYNGFAGAYWPTAGGNDAIYAGAGADWVAAGYGDDYVDGGTGDDVLLGEGGNDDLFGGSELSRSYPRNAANQDAWRIVA